MPTSPEARDFGMERGKVFPAAHARSLVNPLRRLLQSPRRTVAAMELATHDRVLEVGSGPGYFSPSIASSVSEGGLLILDLQAEMVQLARVRMTGSTNVTFAQGDAASLPFVSGHFDGVLLATMLGEVPNQGQCVAEVRRVLRRDGALTVAETRRDSDFIPLATLRDLVERHSFTLVSRRGIAWQYVARFRAI